MTNPTSKTTHNVFPLLHLKTLYTNLLYSLLLVLFNSTLAKSITYNVVDFGAKPNSQIDSTKSFIIAWNKACISPKPSTIYVPHGKFLLGRVTFSGECANKNISIVIDGTLVAPSDYNVIGESNYWLMFEKVSGVSIHGGVLDGKGSSLWDCKNSGKSCPIGAATLGFCYSNNIMVTGLTSINSQMFHIVIYECRNVIVHGVKVVAPENSPNTDGIHVQLSSDVTILKPRIRTGDDCISIGPGSRNLWIEDAVCGPGHGISIGSLGWSLNEPGVKNVTVKSATFSKTQNGFRIKSWGKPSGGFVRHVRFVHAIMSDVQNPVVIDQNYCPFYKGCPTEESGVMIDDVSYKDINGTSATKVAVKFECSSKQPCKGIKLENVKLTYQNQVPKALCNHVAGTAFGTVQPESCL